MYSLYRQRRENASMDEGKLIGRRLLFRAHFVTKQESSEFAFSSCFVTASIVCVYVGSVRSLFSFHLTLRLLFPSLPVFSSIRYIDRHTFGN